MAKSAAGKFYLEHSGAEVDKVVDMVLSWEELGTNKIVESSPEKPVNLDDLKTEEGTFTIYFYVNAGEEQESGKPIEVKVFKDDNGNIIQRYEQNGVTMERKYTKETDTWTEWLPVTEFVTVEGDEKITVAKDTIVFRKVENASKIPR